MTPIIAIPELGPGLLRKYLGSKYVSALKAAGAQVRWIKLADAASVTACDGLLIPGGDDLDPKMYGQTVSEKCGKQNPLRDELDPLLLKAFLETGKPILGVCRGLQMMNVWLGGTLHQDIKEMQQHNHSDMKKIKKGIHAVTVEEGSLLHSITGETRFSVNSLHHQAADRLGNGLTVSARSPEGFPEAIELPGHRFFLGVQWHPEHMQHDPVQKKVIDAFVQACRIK